MNVNQLKDEIKKRGKSLYGTKNVSCWNTLNRFEIKVSIFCRRGESVKEATRENNKEDIPITSSPKDSILESSSVQP